MPSVWPGGGQISPWWWCAWAQVAWVLGLSMGAALMVGAFLGARTAIKGGSKFIRPVFITVVLALTARLVWQHWFG